MKKILKSRVFAFILGALIFSSISVYAAHKYTASDITYKNTTLDQALNTLYTTQNTTVSNLQGQVSSLTSANATLTNEKTTLQSQVNEKNSTIDSLNSRISELEEQNNSSVNSATVSFNIPVSGIVTNNVGFRPTFISCTHKTSLNNISVATFDSKNGNNKVITSLNGGNADIANLSNYYTITNTGFSYNIAFNDKTSEWYNASVYCTVSK